MIFSVICKIYNLPSSHDEATRRHWWRYSECYASIYAAWGRQFITCPASRISQMTLTSGGHIYRIPWFSYFTIYCTRNRSKSCNFSQTLPENLLYNQPNITLDLHIWAWAWIEQHYMRFPVNQVHNSRGSWGCCLGEAIYHSSCVSNFSNDVDKRGYTYELSLTLILTFLTLQH